MADRDQRPRNSGSLEPAAKVDSSLRQEHNESLSGLTAGGGYLKDMATAARRLISDNSVKALFQNNNSLSQQAETGTESKGLQRENLASGPQEQKPATIATHIPLDLKRDYGLDLQYVRHHKPVDATTREGHFLKAGVQEYFWDPNKGQLLSWNSTAKKWETVLPKRDEAAGQRFLGGSAVQSLVGEAIAEQVKKQTSPASVDLTATLGAANELRKGLQEYGSDMEVLHKADRERLSRKEAIIDAIAKICQKDSSSWTPDERSFMRASGVNSESFLKLYKVMCEARESDAIARERHRGNEDTDGLVSFHRRHMADHILDNSFAPGITRAVTRLKSAENPEALSNFMANRRLAV